MKISIPSKKSFIQRTEFNLKVFYYTADNYYEIKAYNNKNEEVARVNFKTNYDPREIWLNKISTDEKYQNKGYATALIKALEYVAYKLRFDQIEGKYYPENSYAKPFYDKYEYIIYKDGYETYITKSLDPDDIKQTIEPYITDYEIITQETDNQTTTKTNLQK